MKYLKPTIRSQKAFDVRAGGISLFGQCSCNGDGNSTPGSSDNSSTSHCNAYYKDPKSTTS